MCLVPSYLHIFPLFSHSLAHTLLSAVTYANSRGVNRNLSQNHQYRNNNHHIAFPSMFDA